MPRSRPFSDRAKGIFRKEKISSSSAEAEVASAQGHVDSFEVDDRLVSISGWAYSTSCADAKRFLIVQDCDGNDVFRCALKGSPRLDVACMLGRPDAIDCGFDTFLEATTPTPLTVKVILDQGGKGAHPSDSEVSHPNGRRSGAADMPPLKEIVAGRIEPNAASGHKMRVVELSPRLQQLARAGQLNPRLPIASAADSHWESMMEAIPTELLTLMADPSLPAIVAFGHSLGGGSEVVLKQRQAAALNNGKRFFIVRFDSASISYTCEAIVDGDLAKGSFHSVEEILARIANIEEILVSEIADYRDIPDLLGFVSAYAESVGAKKSFILFDFISVCASIHLMNYEGRFCGFPEGDECRRCFDIVKGEGAATSICSGRDQYRGYWSKFLEECDVIYSLSEYTKRMVESVYPKLAEIGSIVVEEPTSEYVPTKVERKSRKGSDLVIGVLGVLYPIKGEEIISEIATLAEDPSEGVKLRIIGYCADEDPKLSRLSTGRYDQADLVDIVQNEDIDIFFISSICPETFSLTVSEVMAMGLPFACFDIGAPAERAQSYEKGMTVPYGSTAEEIVDALRTFAFGELHLDELPMRG